MRNNVCARASSERKKIASVTEWGVGGLVPELIAFPFCQDAVFGARALLPSFSRREVIRFRDSWNAQSPMGTGLSNLITLVFSMAFALWILSLNFCVSAALYCAEQIRFEKKGNRINSDTFNCPLATLDSQRICVPLCSIIITIVREYKDLNKVLELRRSVSLRDLGNFDIFYTKLVLATH